MRVLITLAMLLPLVYAMDLVRTQGDVKACSTLLPVDSVAFLDKETNETSYRNFTRTVLLDRKFSVQVNAGEFLVADARNSTDYKGGLYLFMEPGQIRLRLCSVDPVGPVWFGAVFVQGVPVTTTRVSSGGSCVDVTRSDRVTDAYHMHATPVVNATAADLASYSTGLVEAVFEPMRPSSHPVYRIAFRIVLGNVSTPEPALIEYKGESEEDVAHVRVNSFPVPLALLDPESIVRNKETKHKELYEQNKERIREKKRREARKASEEAKKAQARVDKLRSEIRDL